MHPLYLLLSTDYFTVDADMNILISEVPTICSITLIHLDKGRVCLYTFRSHMVHANVTSGGEGSGMEGTKNLVGGVGPGLARCHSEDDQKSGNSLPVKETIINMRF
jgi:hypothetical protein